MLVILLMFVRVWFTSTDGQIVRTESIKSALDVYFEKRPFIHKGDTNGVNFDALRWLVVEPEILDWGIQLHS